MNQGHSNTLEVACEYVKRGWGVIPLESKKPLLSNWTKARLTPEDFPRYFRDGANVGILLGEPSGGLVDVDVDHLMALRLADRFLPATGALFGRASKPRSHRLYKMRGEVPTTRKWLTPSGEALVELRSTGAQTMFPPSVHPSGELVEWERFGEPAEVAAEGLVAACSRLATAALLALHWPPRGSRHEGSLALAGWLLRKGWTEEEAAEFIRAVAEAAGDEEVADRVRSTVTTARRLLEGRPSTGLPRLQGLLGEGVVRRLEEWVARGGFPNSLPGIQSGNREPRRETSRELLRVVRCWEVPEPPPRTWLVPGFLPESCLTIWYGDAGSYKSYLAIGLAVAKAGGREFLGHPLEEGAALYLDAEMDEEEFLRRAYRVARGLGLERPPAGLHYARLPKSLADSTLWEKLQSVVEAVQPALSIVDSLTLGSTGADLERAEDATEILARLAGLGSVLALDHTPKPQPGVRLADLRPYGSFSKWALARHVVQVVRSEGTDALLLRPAKANFGPLLPPVGVAVQFEGDRVRFEVVPLEDERLSGADHHLPRTEQVYRLLCEAGPVRPEELARAMGCSTKTVQNHLSVLRAQGRTRPLERGKWEALRPLPDRLPDEFPDSREDNREGNREKAEGTPPPWAPEPGGTQPPTARSGHGTSGHPEPESLSREEPPSGPCPACGTSRWWRRSPAVGGGWVCARCHPPVTPPVAEPPEPPPSWALELAEALPTTTGIPVEDTARRLADLLEPPQPQPSSGPDVEPEDPPHPPAVCTSCKPTPPRGYFVCTRRGRVLLRLGVNPTRHVLRKLKALGFSRSLLESEAPSALVVVLRGGRGWGWTSMAKARQEGVEGTFGAEPQLAVPLSTFRWKLQEDFFQPWGDS